MMQPPTRRPLPLEDALRFTEDLLQHWRHPTPAGAAPTPTALLVDHVARWMLHLRAEIRAARPADLRRQQLERLLERLDCGLRPRLRGALHQRLPGRVFSLRLRRLRPRVEIE